MPSDDTSPSEPTEGFVEFSRPVRTLFDPAAQTVAPPPLLTALHGQGMSAERFRRVLRHLPATDHARLFPEGPYVFEMRDPPPIRAGHGWYIYLGDSDAFRRELERTEEHLLATLDQIESQYGTTDRSRSVLLGFSQGGYLAGFVGLRHPERFGGVVISAARLKHEFLTNELARGGSSLPAVLLLHSPDDPATAFERAEESRDRLAEAGVDVELFAHEGGHRLPPPALTRVHEWLEERGLSS